METLSEHVKRRTKCVKAKAGEPCEECANLDVLLSAADASMPSEADFEALFAQVDAPGSNDLPMPPAFIEALETGTEYMMVGMFIARYLSTRMVDNENDREVVHEAAALAFISKMIRKAMRRCAIPAILAEMHMAEVMPEPQGPVH